MLRASSGAQQIGDDQRGWAWTRALQGVPANEIHLCGDGSALPLVKRLAAEMDEPLEVIPTPLHATAPHPTGSTSGSNEAALMCLVISAGMDLSGQTQAPVHAKSLL